MRTRSVCSPAVLRPLWDSGVDLHSPQEVVNSWQKEVLASVFCVCFQAKKWPIFHFVFSFIYVLSYLLSAIPLDWVSRHHVYCIQVLSPCPSIAMDTWRARGFLLSGSTILSSVWSRITTCYSYSTLMELHPILGWPCKTSHKKVSWVCKSPWKIWDKTEECHASWSDSLGSQRVSVSWIQQSPCLPLIPEIIPNTPTPLEPLATPDLAVTFPFPSLLLFSTLLYAFRKNNSTLLSSSSYLNSKAHPCPLKHHQCISQIKELCLLANPEGQRQISVLFWQYSPYSQPRISPASQSVILPLCFSTKLKQTPSIPPVLQHVPFFSSILFFLSVLSSSPSFLLFFHLS